MLLLLVIITLCSFKTWAFQCLTNTTIEDIKNIRDKLETLKEDTANKFDALDADLQHMENDIHLVQGKSLKKYNGHCYYFGEPLVTWFEAETKCRHIGGYLIKIDDSSENSWIKTQLNGKSTSYYWIGLIDLKEGQYRWTYDQQLTSYKNYHSGQPDNFRDNQDCMQIDHTHGKWQDEACTDNYKYICENNFCF